MVAKAAKEPMEGDCRRAELEIMGVHNRLGRCSAVVAGFILAAGTSEAAQAQSATGSMTVSTTIASSCSVSNISNVSFGIITGQSISSTDATGSFDVTCTTGTSYSIALNSGQNVTGSTRRMRIGSTANYLTYEIYSNSGRTTVWSTAITGFTGTNSAQTHIAYARLPSQIAPAPGSYTDTITITVAY